MSALGSGGLSEAVIRNYWMSADAQAHDALLKDVAGASALGGPTILFREDLSGILPLMAPSDLPPLGQRFNRIKGNGIAHSWKRLEATQIGGLPFIGGTTTAGGFFAVGGIPTGVNPQYRTVAVPYKNLGDLITVAWQTQASGATYTDIREHQKRVRTIHTKQLEEWCIINGNSNANALQFDGFDIYITQTATVPDNLPWTLFKVIVDCCEVVSYKGGQSRALVMPYPAKSLLNKLLTIRSFPFGGMMNQLGGGVGFSFKQWDFGWGEVDLIPERYITAGAYGYGFYLIDDQTPDAVNNGNTIEMVDLIPLEVVQLATLQTAWRDIVHESTVLKLTCPDFQFKINMTAAQITAAGNGLETIETHVTV